MIVPPGERPGHLAGKDTFAAMLQVLSLDPGRNDMEVHVVIIWQTIYLCIIHFSACMLYIPIFKHFRKHALIFFNSLVIVSSVNRYPKAIFYNEPIQRLPNFLKWQRHREMIRFVQDIKLMDEANEIQVSNHINFYCFRSHFFLLSVTLERGAIFWNICASLMRH